MSQSTKELFSLYFKKNPGIVFIISFSSLLWALTWPASPFLLGVLIDTINQSDPTLLKLETQTFLEWFGITFWQIGWIIVALIGINLLRNCIYFTLGVCFRKSVPASKVSLIKRLYHYLMGQSYSYIENQFSGQLANKVHNAQEGLDRAIQLLNLNLATILALLFSGALLALVSPFFTVVFWLWAISICIFSYKRAIRGKQLSTEYALKKSDMQGHMVDSLSNMATVIVHGNAEVENAKLDTFTEQYYQADITLQKHFNWATFWHGFFYTLFLTVLLVGLIVKFYNQSITPGDFAFILSLCWGMGGFVSDLGKNFLEFFQHLGTLHEGVSLLDVPVNVVDANDAKEIIIENGSIKLNNVFFSYSKKNHVINDLNLDIHPGEKIGLVGHSGCGKTTLLKLLLRLYDINSGEILFDEHTIRSFTLSSLRHNIALVPQDISLFHRSIKDNIAYGSTASYQQIIEAAQQAHIHDFICSLPEGYETIVGQRGLKISGGQRQRIAIAQAILKDPPIVLLDEATSALDSSTEALIQKSLETLMQNRTTLVVAHRLSTLTAMDRIVVMDNGAIVEQGSHQSLLKQKGLYALLWAKQQDGLIE